MLERFARTNFFNSSSYTILIPMAKSALKMATSAGLPRALAQLRFDAMKRMGGESTPAMRAKLLSVYKDLVKKANKEGDLLLLTKGQVVRAGLVIVISKEAFFGVKAKIVIPDLRAGDSGAKRWLIDQLADLKKSFDTKTSIFLPAAYGKLLPDLLQMGFSVDSLILEGEPKKSLKALLKKFDPPADLSLLGLSSRRAQRKDIPKILALSKKEFLRNPQYGWFCASPEFLAAQKKELTKAMKSSDHSHYIIEKGAAFLGYFGSDATAGAKQAGVTLIFDQKIQGLGIAKTAYLILLGDMVKKKVVKYRGGTAQPAVLNLGKIMGRKMTSSLLRFREGSFPRGHFKSYLSGDTA